LWGIHNVVRNFLIFLIILGFCFTSSAEAFEYSKLKANKTVTHVLIIDPKKSKIDVVTGNDFRLIKPNKLANYYKAKCAINGTFFAPRYSSPIGLIISNGNIISSSFDSRSVFGIKQDGTPFISNIRVYAVVSVDGFLSRFFVVNQPYRDGQNILFTTHFGKTTRTKITKYRREIAVNKEGIVVSILNGNQKIPENGYVLSVYGNSWLNNLKIGNKVKIYTDLLGEWENTRLAVGGGPLLVNNGKINITAQKEYFKYYVANSSVPRTAIGYTKTGKVLMVVTNKADLNRLAAIMVKLGAVKAINLDGGGSSIFYYKGKILNRTYDGRSIHNMIIIR